MMADVTTALCPGCENPSCWEWGVDGEGNPQKISYCKGNNAQDSAPATAQFVPMKAGEDAQGLTGEALRAAIVADIKAGIDAAMEKLREDILSALVEYSAGAQSGTGTSNALADTETPLEPGAGGSALTPGKASKPKRHQNTETPPASGPTDGEPNDSGAAGGEGDAGNKPQGDK